MVRLLRGEEKQAGMKLSRVVISLLLIVDAEDHATEENEKVLFGRRWCDSWHGRRVVMMVLVYRRKVIRKKRMIVG